MGLGIEAPQYNQGDSQLSFIHQGSDCPDELPERLPPYRVISPSDDRASGRARRHPWCACQLHVTRYRSPSSAGNAPQRGARSWQQTARQPPRKGGRRADRLLAQDQGGQAKGVPLPAR